MALNRHLPPPSLRVRPSKPPDLLHGECETSNHPKNNPGPKDHEGEGVSSPECFQCVAECSHVNSPSSMIEFLSRSQGIWLSFPNAVGRLPVPPQGVAHVEPLPSYQLFHRVALPATSTRGAGPKKGFGKCRQYIVPLDQFPS